MESYFNESQDLSHYLSEISKFSILTPQEEKELGQRIQEGDPKALKELVESNLRFVVHVANKLKNANVSLMDLINEGNIGLIQAAKRYDPTKENRFITYAFWWIRQAILHALSQAGNFSMPQRRLQQLYQMEKVFRGLSRELKRSPSVKEVADEMGISPGQVQVLQQVSGDILSLNAPITGSRDIELQETLPEKREPSPEYHLLSEAFTQELEELLDTLLPREKEVLEMRFGLKGLEPMTLKSIAVELHASKERIRQIEGRALRKIRSKQKARKLLGYLN